jgi:hypothetical protein
VNLTALIVPAFLLASQPTKADCPDLAACRQAALEAAEQQDFERFHDLAWRAIQKGRPNDPALMWLVARAQSLSGRPGDALVMVRRLAQMGVATDARENDDFRAVRELPGWPEVEVLIARTAENVATAPGASRGASSGVASAANEKPAARSNRAMSEKIGPPGTARSLAPAGAVTTGAEETVRLAENTIEPIGLAYDGASRRFVVGDRRANKLIVADEVFKQVNDLIGATSAGFGALTALEIDARRGDLWVTSSSDRGAAIHKLQLVSGRVLLRIEVSADAQPATFSDIFVSESGALWTVDAREGRLFRLRAADGRVERAWPLNLNAPTSLAIVNDRAYVAHDGGLALVDLGSGAVTEIRAAKDLSLAGVRRVRWNRGALIAIQGDGGTARLIRLRLARNGEAVTTMDVLDDNVDTEGAALTISRDAAYYVAHTSSGPIIKKLGLR